MKLKCALLLNMASKKPSKIIDPSTPQNHILSDTPSTQSLHNTFSNSMKKPHYTKLQCVFLNNDFIYKCISCELNNFITFLIIECDGSTVISLHFHFPKLQFPSLQFPYALISLTLISLDYDSPIHRALHSIAGSNLNKVKSWRQIQVQHQSTYLIGPDSTSIQIV